MKKTILIAMLMVCSALMATLPNTGDRKQRQATQPTFTVVSQPYERHNEGTIVKLGARVQLSFNEKVYYDSAEKYEVVPTALSQLLVFNVADTSLEERVRKFFENPTEFSIRFRPLRTVVQGK